MLTSHTTCLRPPTNQKKPKQPKPTALHLTLVPAHQAQHPTQELPVTRTKYPPKSSTFQEQGDSSLTNTGDARRAAVVSPILGSYLTSRTYIDFSMLGFRIRLLRKRSRTEYKYYMIGTMNRSCPFQSPSFRELHRVHCFYVESESISLAGFKRG